MHGVDLVVLREVKTRLALVEQHAVDEGLIVWQDFESTMIDVLEMVRSGEYLTAKDFLDGIKGRTHAVWLFPHQDATADSVL